MEKDSFYQEAEELFLWLMEKNPVMATYMGIHKWDDQLGDLSLEGQNEIKRKLKRYLKKVNKLDSQFFNREKQIDYTIFKQLLKKYINIYELDKPYFNNPDFYMETVFGGIMSLIIKDFAPLSRRIESLLGRIEDIPEVLSRARDNLKINEIPPVWAKVALKKAQMAPAIFNEISSKVENIDQSIKKDLNQVSGEIAEDIKKFAEYLENDVLPAAKGDFAVGEDRFNQKLKEEHLVNYDADQLIKRGREIFEQTKKEMQEKAKKIDPDREVKKILKKSKSDHPQPENLLSTYKEVMQETRQYVLQNEIATIPENEKLSIIETPSYLHHIIPYAAYQPPGIFEDKTELEGMFLVTPVDKEASGEEQKEKLKGHNYNKLPITALHEGYPGHHLQLVWSVIEGSMVRKFGSNLSSLFVEGWAFYCEELMEDLGYIDSHIQKLSRLSDQLWRAARIILDVSLHCRDMGIEEAVEFLVKNCQLEKSNARAEVRRYTSTPTQPQSYLMGKFRILKIIDRYKKENPDKTLKEVHDVILSSGSLPPKLLKKQLF